MQLLSITSINSDSMPSEFNISLTKDEELKSPDETPTPL